MFLRQGVFAFLQCACRHTISSARGQSDSQRGIELLLATPCIPTTSFSNYPAIDLKLHKWEVDTRTFAENWRLWSSGLFLPRLHFCVPGGRALDFYNMIIQYIINLLIVQMSFSLISLVVCLLPWSLQQQKFFGHHNLEKSSFGYCPLILTTLKKLIS